MDGDPGAYAAEIANVAVPIQDAVIDDAVILDDDIEVNQVCEVT